MKIALNTEDKTKIFSDTQMLKESIFTSHSKYWSPGQASPQHNGSEVGPEAGCLPRPRACWAREEPGAVNEKGAVQ